MGLVSYEHILHLFSGVIRLWLECVVTSVLEAEESAERSAAVSPGSRRVFSQVAPIDLDEEFYEREKHIFFQKVSRVEVAAFNIIKFCTKAAHQTESLRAGLVEAGALSLVLSLFAGGDYKLLDLIDASELRRSRGNKARTKHVPPVPTPIPLDALNTEASTLTVLIQDPIFKQSWTRDEFQTRRYLSSIFVEILLGNSASLKKNYAWTRALFRKITA